MVAGEGTEDEVEAQLRTAVGSLQRAVAHLLEEGEAHPRLVILALARVTGEAGTAAALADGEDPEVWLAELAEAMREAGREFREMLRAEALPTAGNA